MQQDEAGWKKLLKGSLLVPLIIGVVVGFFVTAPDWIPDWLFSGVLIPVLSLASYAVYRALFAPVPTVEERDRVLPADRRRWVR